MAQKTCKIAPSILSADFSKLGEEVQKLDKAGADYIHFDIMDGAFVPNITIGPQVIASMRGSTNLPFDTHLMINSPEKYIEKFAEVGSDIITVHIEAVTHLDRVIKLIKSFGKKAGVSLVPSTSEILLDYIYDDVDLILVMTVNPGFGGQVFMKNQLPKIEKIRQKIMASGRDIELQVDGGINPDTAIMAINAGADVLVAGSSVFKTSDYEGNIKKLRT